MHVRQAANVLDLLDFFARRRSTATLAEIAEALEWPKSSTFNLVGTLSEKGFLYEPQMRGGYYPTPLWLTLSRQIAEAEPLPEALHAIATLVARETNETTAIGAPAGTYVMFLDVVESTQPVRYFAQIGDRVPIHASSAGRGLLAQYSAEERQALYRKIQFEHFTDRTPMSVDAVESELRKATKRGYHQSNGEYVPDLAGVAVSIALPQRRLSLVVAGPTSRCLDRRTDIAEIMRRSVARFTKELAL